MQYSGAGSTDHPERLTAAELLRAGEICVSKLRASDLEVGQEFFGAGIHEVVAKIGKPFLTKQLDPWHNDFTTNRHYWTTLRHDGDLVGISGARIDDISSGEFVPFLRNQMRRLFSQGKGEVLAPQAFPPEFRNIQGSVAYLGDFFVMPEHRGKSFDKAAYTLLLYVQAMVEWRFDYLYLFINRHHGERDYFAKYCMPMHYPASLLWTDPPPERNDSDYIGILSRESFTWILRRFLARPDLF